MKKLYIIANWKSNKTTLEAREWLQEYQMSNIQYPISNGDKEVIVCPAFTLLSTVKQEMERLKLPIKIGSQDFSAFPDGSYTGEEPPILLKEYIQYAIIGHSERRKNLAETDELIAEKIKESRNHGITPILCIQDVNTLIPEGVSIVAYEPVFAIGTGNPDTPENAQKVATEIHVLHDDITMLYGGSVTGENVSAFTSQPNIHGVLVGKASLNPTFFAQIVKNA